MAIQFVVKPEHVAVEQESVLHYIPCSIYGDTPANVSTYFTPYIKKADDKRFDASFRGRSLHGKVITVPQGYKGFVLHESKKPADVSKQRTFTTNAGFSKFMYWNYDKLPSKNDTMVAALKWIDIAEAIHAPEGTSSSNLE